MPRLANETHCTRTHKFFINQHPGNNCVLFIDLFTNRHVSAINKNNQSVFLFQLLQFDYEIWEIIIYFTTCFSFWRLFYSLPTFRTKYLEVGPLGETYFFLLKTTQIWIITIVVVLDQSTVAFQKGWGGGYYNLCGIRSKYSNISKREGITICVVLHQNHGNVMFYQLVSNLQSMFPSYEVFIAFQSPLLTNKAK
jgi:hypothetical protein